MQGEACSSSTVSAKAHKARLGSLISPWQSGFSYALSFFPQTSGHRATTTEYVYTTVARAAVQLLLLQLLLQ